MLVELNKKLSGNWSLILKYIYIYIRNEQSDNFLTDALQLITLFAFVGRLNVIVVLNILSVHFGSLYFVSNEKYYSERKLSAICRMMAENDRV